MAKKTRNIRLKTALIFILTACSLSIVAQENGYLRNGNNLYQTEEYEKAEAEYQKALDANDESYKAHFNMADALYEQKKDSLAQEHFSQALVRAENKSDRADALYNLGNVALRKKDWQGAINHFRESLLNKAGNSRAQYNLSYAMKKLKHQQESQRESKGKDKEQEKKKDPKSQKNKKEKKGQGQQKQHQQKEEKQDSQSEKEKEAQKQQEALNRKEVQKLLEAVRREEREVQKRIMHQKLRSNPKRSDKEW